MTLCQSLSLWVVLLFKFSHQLFNGFGVCLRFVGLFVLATLGLQVCLASRLTFIKNIIIAIAKN